MQFFPTQQLRQKQSLVITPQLQQAIRLLTLTNVELKDFVENQCEENPFLETKAGQDGDVAADASSHESQGQDNASELDFSQGKIAADGPISDTAYDNKFETGRIDLGRTRQAASSDFDALSTIAADEGLSLYAHACAEAERMFSNPADQMVALAIIDALEPSGRLGQSVEDIASFVMVEQDHVLSVLTQLQQIEPAGLFARDLRECLRLQAQDRNVLTPDFALLLDNLEMLGSGNLKALTKLCRVNADRMNEMLRTLRSLEPKPGTRFDHKADPIQPPDLIVQRRPDGWSIELNRSTLPAVRIRETYARDVVKNDRDETLKSFVTERVSEARWLDRAIAQRNETALKIGAEIVRLQIGFFEKGPAHLKPLVLRDIAEAIGMHESTVSRVTASLMIATPQGTFRLKTFFSSGLSNDTDSDGTSAAAIKYQLKKLIESEPPHSPYSDDAIVKIMGNKGVRLARRTVAKYRDMENIPSSFQRKRNAVLAGRL